MSTQNQQELQSQWNKKQGEIREEVTSEDKSVSVIFNGLIEILYLKINDDSINHMQLEQSLISCINKGIKNVALKAQQEFIAFQKQIQNS